MQNFSLEIRLTYVSSSHAIVGGVIAICFLYVLKIMDDAGDIAPAAAMGMMIFYTNAAVRIAYVLITKKVLVRFQKWRYKT